MKDIDFDELDRAVSSVLNGTTSTAAPDSVADSGSVDASSALEARATPESVTFAVGSHGGRSGTITATADESSSSRQPEPLSSAPSSITPLAVKRRGKFMDVMHPSHDMAPTEPSPSASRRSPLLPISDNVVPEDEATSSAANDSRDTSPAMSPEEVAYVPDDDSSNTDLHKPSSGRPDAESVYVDPIDFAAQQTAVDEPLGEVSVPSQDELTSSPTPFIDDARVEKRPLGAFGESDTPTGSVDEPTVGASDEAELSTDGARSGESDGFAQVDDDAQTAPAVSLPRELQPDIVQVEAVQDEAGLPEAMTATGHPLFDTSTYHEPVAAKPKKTSGRILWVVGFLLCLAIGGGAGYIMFTSGF